jgi:hypothetical protein
VRLTPTSVNSYLRVLKAWLRWLKIPGTDGAPIPVISTSSPPSASYIHHRTTTCVTRGEADKYVWTAGVTAREDLLGHRSASGLFPSARNYVRIYIAGSSSSLNASQDSWLFPTERAHISYRNMHRDFVSLCKSVGISGRRMSVPFSSSHLCYLVRRQRWRSASLTTGAGAYESPDDFPVRADADQRSFRRSRAILANGISAGKGSEGAVGSAGTPGTRPNSPQLKRAIHPLRFEDTPYRLISRKLPVPTPTPRFKQPSRRALLV